VNPPRASRRIYRIGLVCLAACLGGCDAHTSKWSWLNPSTVVRPPADGPSTRVILDSLGVIDQTTELPRGATFPTRADLEYDDSDYVLGPQDIVSVAILDLYFEGGETVVQKTISETGYIDLPLLPDRIEAAGRNKEQLKEAIIDAYVDAGILKRSTAGVTLEILVRRQSVFNILGAIAQPGQYSLTRKGMRLLESLAIARGITQPNIKYLYVIRGPGTLSRGGAAPPAIDRRPTPANGAGNGMDLEKGLDALRKGVQGVDALAGSVFPPLSEIAPGGGSATGDTDPGELRPGTKPKWSRRGERWSRSGGLPDPSSLDEPADDDDDPFGFSRLARGGGGERVIAIDIKQLREGVGRMNIVIRNHDVIQVPALEIGEYYIGGQINRPGAYNITGRKITLKNAVAAAGGLGQLAWPENTVLVRRIGANQELHVPVNLRRILQGDEPDIFLKPNDTLEIGTHWSASFLAVFRNAFRATVGFGGIYDRNFAEPIFRADSRRFTRW